MTTLEIVAKEARAVFTELLNATQKTDPTEEIYVEFDKQIYGLITRLNMVQYPRLDELDHLDIVSFTFQVVGKSFSFVEIRDVREYASFKTSSRYAQFKLWSLVRQRGELKERE